MITQKEEAVVAMNHLKEILIKKHNKMTEEEKKEIRLALMSGYYDKESPFIIVALRILANGQEL